MVYRVKITPGKNTVLPEELDEELKLGCEEAVQYGTNIYVCGMHGSGKSSVLEYFKSKAWDYFGVNESEILFMTDFDFVDTIINGIRNDSLENFRSKCADAKLIIIDDIDRLRGKEATLCEFRHILESGKTIIVSGPPMVSHLLYDEDITNKIKHFTIMQIDYINEEYIDDEDKQKEY